MHVAVIGPGVLGRIYGVALHDIGERVSFVVRPGRVSETEPFAIERVSGGDRRSVASPVRVATVPKDADLVLVTVRFDQIDPTAEPSQLALALGGTRAPVVVLTPLLPRQRARLEDLLGRPIVSAMPGAVGYFDARGVIRYWVPILASTLIDEQAQTAGDRPSGDADRGARENLAERLTKAGIPTRLEKNVAETNAATTVAFFPLIAAIDAGRGIDLALSDKALLDDVLAAADECSKVARSIGKLAPWASVLNRFVGPFTLKAGVSLARRLYPESVQFVDAHFGPKLHAQHVAMAHAIIELSQERGFSSAALERLVRRL